MVPITVWQVARNWYRNLSRRRRKETTVEWIGRKIVGGEERGCALSHVGKNVLSVTFFRSVLRGVKGIRSLSRRANSRLAELSGTARESEAGRRDGRPWKFSTTFAKWIPMLLPLPPPHIFDKREKQLDFLLDVWTFPRHLYEISLFRARACVCMCVYRLDSGREEKISSWRSFFLLVLLFERTDKWMF